MDSEGLGGVDKSHNYDVKIFTLTTLLSNFLIFNQVGVIDENAIQNLSVVT
jgi:Guanylate-binding protein, N-terminal domain